MGFVLSLASPAGAQTNVADPPPAKLDSESVPDAIRSFLQLQEQVHAAQLAIERNRKEAELAAARNAAIDGLSSVVPVGSPGSLPYTGSHAISFGRSGAFLISLSLNGHVHVGMWLLTQSCVVVSGTGGTASS